jgi:exopolysaccharide production protein ExoZ
VSGATDSVTVNPSVEGWRGLAALMVLISHWLPTVGIQHSWVTFAFTGVDVFFVLSGFVFAPQCLGVQSQPLAGYALRRVMRIYPSYLVALAVYVVLAITHGRPVLYLGEHLLMGHVQNREMAFYYCAPFWSLPSELEFYALVPLLGWVLARWRRPWALPMLLVAATGSRLVLLGAADGETQNAAYIWLHHLPGVLVEFLFGVWAWQLHRQTRVLQWRWAVALAGLTGVLLCGVLFQVAQTGPDGPHWTHGQLGLGVAAAFALTLTATAGLEVPAGRMQTICAWAGRLSYGTYLLHSAWMVAISSWAARWGAGAALAIGAAGLAVSVLALHLIVEEPLRRWGRRTAVRLN